MCIWKTHRVKINLEAQRKQHMCTFESILHMNFLITVRCIILLKLVTLRRFNTICAVVMLQKPMGYLKDKTVLQK